MLTMRRVICREGSQKTTCCTLYWASLLGQSSSAFWSRCLSVRDSIASKDDCWVLPFDYYTVFRKKRVIHLFSHIFLTVFGEILWNFQQIPVSEYVTHTHPLNGPFSVTTQVSRYQKGKTNLNFTEARDREWQWHRLDHMQVCTSLQTDNHTGTPTLNFLQAGCPSCRPTNSVKVLKANKWICQLMVIWFWHSRLNILCAITQLWRFCNNYNSDVLWRR